MCILKSYLWPIKCLAVPDLYAIVLACSQNHLSFMIVGASENTCFQALCVFCLQNVSLGEILVNSIQLGVHVPLTNATIQTWSYEQFLVLRMELPTGNWSHMPLRVHHILNVHISPDCCFELLTIAGINTSLVVCTAAQKHTSVGVWRKTKWPNRMAIEWPELFVRS